jgi:hypothetical protein
MGKILSARLLFIAGFNQTGFGMALEESGNLLRVLCRQN